MLQALGTVGLIVLGALLTLATTATVEWLRDERMTRRARAQARGDFQRQTLLDLQDAVADLVRAAGMAQHEDAMNYRQTGKWRWKLLSKEANDLDFDARGRCRKFRVRVQDEQVRTMVEQLQSETANVIVAKSEDESMAMIVKASDLVKPINERIGQLLREL